MKKKVVFWCSSLKPLSLKNLRITLLLYYKKLKLNVYLNWNWFIHGFHSLFFSTISSISITPSFHLFPPPSKSYTPLQTTTPTRFHHSLRKSTKRHRFIPTNKLNSCFIPMLLNKTTHSRAILFRRRCFHLRNIPNCAGVCISDDTLGSIFE